MRTGVAILAGALAVVLAIGPAPSVRADDPPDPRFEQTPPRLSFTDGQVSFWRPGAEDWVGAQVNTPLAPGDMLSTGSPGTLEIQIGARAFLRAWTNTQLGLAGQEPDFIQFTLVAGSAVLDLRALEPGETVEMATPNAAVTIRQAGYYRVDTTGERSRVMAREGGRATVTPASGQAVTITPSEELVIEGTESAQLAAYAVPPLDDWDRWNYTRTDRLLDAVSARYVSCKGPLHLGQPVGVGTQVEEAEWIRRAKLDVGLDERAAVGQLCDPLTRSHGKVMAALRAHAQRLLDLVVAIVRMAARAGVGMPLRVVRPAGLAVLDGHVDPALHGRHLRVPNAGAALRNRAAPASRTSGSAFPGAGPQAGEADPRDRPHGGNPAENRGRLRDRRATRLGHEADDLVLPVEHVDVERDVDGIRSLERAGELICPRSQPARRDELDLGGIEVAGADERRVRRVARARIEQHPERHPPPDSRWGALGGVQVAMGIQPDDCERSWRVARPSTAPTWEQQQPPSTTGRSGSAAASAKFCSVRLLSAMTAVSG